VDKVVLIKQLPYSEVDSCMSACERGEMVGFVLCCAVM